MAFADGSTMARTFWGVFPPANCNILSCLSERRICSTGWKCRYFSSSGNLDLHGTLIFFVLLALANLTVPVVSQVSGRPTLTVQKEEDAEGIQTTTEFLLSTVGVLTNESHNAENLTFLQENVSTNAVIEVIPAEVTTPAEVTMALGTSIVQSNNTPEDSTPQLPSVDQEKRRDAEMKEYHDIFIYDYESLRKWGLVAAAILFILGILILTCDKHGKFPRCRGKKQARTYVVSLP
ncbi:FXYD domain-containing ion transport regulator 5 isoform X1 [Protobothrops mucrosquamatus]|uniref:FXYD domain-containing ion transport regulator 5 isoform X1 n=1 Tax=Protobothrops mucrosquamatus TaxID=103944 RepID=UPI000775A258|nr:FXYD domain-containing ion transport regulator 5 isoform X1 [Protobothrops mucrosquamatus]